MHFLLKRWLPSLALLLFASTAGAQSLDGLWVVDRERSVDFDPWRDFRVTLSASEAAVTIDRFWGAGRYTQRDSITVPLGRSVRIPARPGKWMDQVYLGAFVPQNATRTVEASISNDGRTLTVETEMPLESSQAYIAVTISSAFTVAADGSELTLIETRSTRATGTELRYVFRKK